jgi:hypothetical protein
MGNGSYAKVFAEQKLLRRLGNGLMGFDLKKSPRWQGNSQKFQAPNIEIGHNMPKGKGEGER